MICLSIGSLESTESHIYLQASSQVLQAGATEEKGETARMVWSYLSPFLLCVMLCTYSVLCQPSLQASFHGVHAGGLHRSHGDSRPCEDHAWAKGHGETLAIILSLELTGSSQLRCTQCCTKLASKCASTCPTAGQDLAEHGEGSGGDGDK